MAIIEGKEDALAAAVALSQHGNKYSADDQAKIRAYIRQHASASINLVASSGEIGKTTAQPRQFGGRFGVKGQMVTYSPNQISEAIAQLKPGQSINLPNNKGKVKRLSRGFQVVSASGDTNVVLKSPAEAATKANGLVGPTPTNKGVKQ